MDLVYIGDLIAAVKIRPLIISRYVLARPLGVTTSGQFLKWRIEKVAKPKQGEISVKS